MRRVMMFMPMIFVLVVIRFPAGVLVYWITTNAWTIGQQYIVKQRMGPMQAADSGSRRVRSRAAWAREGKAALPSGDGARTTSGRDRPEKASAGQS